MCSWVGENRDVLVFVSSRCLRDYKVGAELKTGLSFSSMHSSLFVSHRPALAATAK